MNQDTSHQQQQCSQDWMFTSMSATSVCALRVHSSHPQTQTHTPFPPPHPHPNPPRDSPRLIGRSGPGIYQITAFALGPSACESLCAPFKRNLYFPKSCRSPVIKPHWCSKLNALGACLPRCWTPRLGSLICGSELSLLWENLHDIIILQSPTPGDMGFDYIVSPLLLPISWFFPYVFSCRWSFLEGSSLFHQLLFCR